MSCISKCVHSSFLLYFLLLYVIPQVVSGCKPEQLRFKGARSLIRRSLPQTVYVEYRPCPDEGSLNYKWQFYKRPINSSEGFEPISTWYSTDTTITIRGYDLDFHRDGVFKNEFQCTVRLSYDNIDFSDKSFTFTFQASDLTIVFKQEVYNVHENESCTVDATDTYDDSYSPSEDPFETISTAWRFDGVLLTNQLEHERFRVFVKPYSLSLGLHELTLIINRTAIPNARYKTFSDTAFASIIPNDERYDLRIKCLENCGLADSRKDVVLEFTCLGFDGELEISYRFFVGKEEIDEEILVMEEESMIYTVPGGLYEPGDQAMFAISMESGIMDLLTMFFMLDIPEGSCGIDPKEGAAGITYFSITCTGFNQEKDATLTYSVYHGSPDVLITQETQPDMKYVHLLEGSMPVKIIVRNLQGAEKEVSIQVTVRNFPDVEAFIKNATFGHERDNILPHYLIGDNDYVVQLACAVVSALSQVYMPDKDKEKVKARLLYMLDQLEATLFYHVEQITLAVTFMMHHEDFNDPYLHNVISDILHNLSKDLLRLKEEYTRQQLNNLTITFCNIVSELLVPMERYVERVSGPDEVQNGLIPIYRDLDPTRVKVKLNEMDVTNRTHLTLENLGAVLLRKMTPGEVRFEIEAGDVIIKLVLDGAENLTGSLLQEIEISQDLSHFLQTQYGLVSLQITVLPKHSFWWHVDHDDIKTKILLVNLRDHKSEFQIKEVPYPVQINLNATDTDFNNVTLYINSSLTVHRLDVTKTGLIKIIIYIQASANVAVKILPNCRPSKNETLKGNIMNGNMSEEARTIILQEKKGTILYIGLIAINESATIILSISEFGCVNYNTTSTNWDHDHCSVSTKSNNTLVQCQCLRLSAFAGNILVPPNHLSKILELDFRLELRNNYLVLITVLLILLAFLILLLWGRWSDIKKKPAGQAHPLKDNVPGDKHMYTVIINTGWLFESGTSATVAFQFFGTKSNSRVHAIESTSGYLQRGNEDWFLMFTPEDLDVVALVKIWHDCSGERPHWYCSRVKVIHNDTHVEYTFKVEQWLSPLWGEGKVSIEVESDIEQYSRWQLFIFNLRNNFKDKMLWCSICWRPPHSTFTTKERVACAICFVLINMLSSAMFFGIPRKDPTDQIDNDRTFHVRHIVIMVESLLVTVPIAFVIGMLFKNSAPRHAAR